MQADQIAERFRESSQALGVDIPAAEKQKAFDRLRRRFQPDCLVADPDVIEQEMRSGLRASNALSTRHGEP